MKIVVWLLIAVMLTGIVYAFSTCRAEQSDGRDVLTLLDRNQPDYIKMNRRRIAVFERENPDIKVRLIAGGSKKYMTMVSGGVAPDVSYAAYQSMPYYAKRKAILLLDDFIANDKDFSMEMFFPAAVKSVQYHGKYYGVPDNGSPVALFYNKNLFDEYNEKNKNSGKPLLEYPNEKWTWADFRHAAKELTQDRDGDGRTDVFGTIGQFSSNRFPPYVWQNGGEVISADKRRCMMDSPEAIAAMQWLYDIMWVDKSAPTSHTQIEGVSQQTTGILFKEERIAMVMDTRYLYIALKGKTRFTWDIAPLPRGPGGRATVYIGGQWLISSQTHYPEKAWRLAKFLVSDLSSELSMQTGRAMAANRAVTERLLKHPGIPPEHDYRWVQIMADARPKDFQFVEMGSYLSKAADEIIYLSQGRRTPEEACRNFTRIYQKGLDIMWEKEGGP